MLLLPTLAFYYILEKNTDRSSQRFVELLDEFKTVNKVSC